MQVECGLSDEQSWLISIGFLSSCMNHEHKQIALDLFVFYLYRFWLPSETSTTVITIVVVVTCICILWWLNEKSVETLLVM